MGVLKQNTYMGIRYIHQHFWKCVDFQPPKIGQKSVNIGQKRGFQPIRYYTNYLDDISNQPLRWSKFPTNSPTTKKLIRNNGHIWNMTKLCLGCKLSWASYGIGRSHLSPTTNWEEHTSHRGHDTGGPTEWLHHGSSQGEVRWELAFIHLHQTYKFWVSLKPNILGFAWNQKFWVSCETQHTTIVGVSTIVV